jgi:hypothetical protein
VGLFEENPLLLVPFVLLVVAGYDATKWAIKRLVQARLRARAH